MAPGITDSGNAVFKTPEARERMSELSAYMRVGEPEEVADVVTFLATDQARRITGAFVDATGGSLLGQAGPSCRQGRIDHGTPGRPRRLVPDGSGRDTLRHCHGRPDPDPGPDPDPVRGQLVLSGAGAAGLVGAARSMAL
ncbi:hypothetical protein GCM10011578_095240 [Streptomyces fuscichromogenes]|uniref:SDR family oxidoreductase n=1 Tax=Streptomyces fuscichromogenes TaxID=1324013 RepID=A0A918CXA2_9ACTN|nr:hypothetical protein GCM10011578_095240 [Streptomyces fuscichromogenes]